MARVMIIDDSPVIRKVTRRLLETMHLDPLEAESGADALNACARAMPDAIVVKATLQGMDGCDFLRELRKMPHGEKPKVLYCLIDNDPAQIAKGMHAGADEHLFKPFDRQSLHHKLHTIGLI